MDKKDLLVAGVKKMAVKKYRIVLMAFLICLMANICFAAAFDPGEARVTKLFEDYRSYRDGQIQCAQHLKKRDPWHIMENQREKNRAQCKQFWASLSALRAYIKETDSMTPLVKEAVTELADQVAALEIIGLTAETAVNMSDDGWNITVMNQTALDLVPELGGNVKPLPYNNALLFEVNHVMRQAGIAYVKYGDKADKAVVKLKELLHIEA